MGSLRVRRGLRAALPTLNSGEPGFSTDTKRLYIGNTDSVNVEFTPAAETTDYTVFVASATYGGDTQANGKTGRSLASGSATSTSANQLVDSAASFTSALVGEAIYNSTDDTWAKITSYISATTLGLSANIMASGESYSIASAVSNIPDAWNIADAGFRANIIVRATPESFAHTLTLIGKTAGGAKTITLQGSTTGTTTIAGEVSIYQKIYLKNLTLTKRVFEYFGADVDWTTCVTSGDDGFIITKSTSIANTFRTSSNVIFQSDPGNYINISSTVTKGYTLYVATSTYGGDDTVADGLLITQGSATSTSAGKLVDTTANFNSTDHLNKTLYNSTDDTWAKITAIDSTTQVSISVDIMASGESYKIGNAFATIQGVVNTIPGSVNCTTTIKISGEIYREDIDIWGKNFTGTYSILVVGTRSVLTSGTATSGANLAGNGSAGYGTITNTGAGWTVSAYINKFIEITGGTGAGQIRVCHANTATVLTIVGRWATVPDATSTYKIVQIETRATGADAGAETTNIRDYVFKTDNGQKGIELWHLKIDYAGNDNFEGGVMIFGGSACQLYHCHIEGNSYWGVHATAGSTGRMTGCAGYLQVIGDLRVDYGASFTRVKQCRFTAWKNRSVDCSAGYIFDLYETYIGAGTGAGSIGIIAAYAGSIYTDGYLEIDGSPSHNVIVKDNAVFFTNSLYGARSTQVVKNAGGWGIQATTGGVGTNVIAMTYSGNTSGTYTPTTAAVGGNT